MRKFIIGGVCAALILTACGGGPQGQPGSGGDAAKPAGNDRTYDVSGMRKVDEIDLGKALGEVLGVETEVSPGEFASLLPGIGSKYDLGISAFTITDERTANHTMISISEVGSSFAAKAGNPKGFGPDRPKRMNTRQRSALAARTTSDDLFLDVTP